MEEMKEAVTKVIDTLTQEDFHGALKKLFERYNKCIAPGRDYFEGDMSSMCVLSIKVPIRKKSGNLFNDPPTSTSGIYFNRANLCRGFKELHLFVFSNLQSSLLRCGTRPNEWGAHWDSNSLV